MNPLTVSESVPQPIAECRIALLVNGAPVRHTLPVNTTLAELLRGQLRLTGTKVACNEGACGACTVWLDGRVTLACHTLAAQCAGAVVTTIEALSPGGNELTPLQRAFVEHDALQCGFCTPGMLMALQAAIDAGARTRAQMAAAIAGNACRCGAYLHLLDAAVDAATRA
jgi:xanthine dehydrogenase YagT iron-sulfur-binding subunit